MRSEGHRLPKRIARTRHLIPFGFRTNYRRPQPSPRPLEQPEDERRKERPESLVALTQATHNLNEFLLHRTLPPGFEKATEGPATCVVSGTYSETRPEGTGRD